MGTRLTGADIKTIMFAIESTLEGYIAAIRASAVFTDKGETGTSLLVPTDIGIKTVNFIMGAKEVNQKMIRLTKNKELKKILNNYGQKLDGYCFTAIPK